MHSIDLEEVLEQMAEQGWEDFIDETSGIEDYTVDLIKILGEMLDCNVKVV